jgi:hypothetical protein
MCREEQLEIAASLKQALSLNLPSELSPPFCRLASFPFDFPQGSCTNRIEGVIGLLGVGNNYS